MKVSATNSWQIGVPLLLLIVILGTFFGLDWIARNRWIADQIHAWDVKRFKDGKSYFNNNGNFIDFEDRLLLEELPGADYSKGGVHYFGTSALKWSLMTWELPPDERCVVGNYGLGATSHLLQLQFIRYLVDYDGLLQAGGGNEQVVLGAYYSMGMEWQSGYFGRLWSRHGLYAYDPDTGIKPAKVAPLRRILLLAKARCSGFVLGNFKRMGRFLVTALGGKLTATEKITDQRRIERIVGGWVNRPGWEEELSREIDSLGQTIDYLRDRNVSVTVALLPMRRAFFEFSQPVTYLENVKGLCARKGVPCADLTTILNEDEFWDLNHPNFTGLEKTHGALMRLARSHLRKLGVSTQ